MTNLSVPEMSCGHCKAAIEKAVAAADTAANLQFNMENRTVRIETTLENAALQDVLKSEGYDSTVV